MTANEVTHVVDDPDEQRYEIVVDGDLAGFTTYHDHGRRRTLIHTEIDAKNEGRGFGSTLVRAALEDIHARGLELLPVCPFVRTYVQEHVEYVDLVPVSERERFGL